MKDRHARFHSSKRHEKHRVLQLWPTESGILTVPIPYPSCSRADLEVQRRRLAVANVREARALAGLQGSKRLILIFISRRCRLHIRKAVVSGALAVLFCAAGHLAARTSRAQEQGPVAGGSAAAPGSPNPGRGGRGGGGRGRGPNFPQQTRQLASQEVIARGKAVYGVNCTACHGADLRGGDLGGPNLLRSAVTLNDQHGELVMPIIRGARQDKGMPAFNLGDDDIGAVAEYIHSVLARVGAQGRPPGSDQVPELQVIVGSALAGKTYFDAKCASCHSITRDLAGYASKYDDPRMLQNTWVSGGTGGGRGFGPAVPDTTSAKPTTVTVTMANGQKLEGTLLQQNDFIVTLILPDGTRRSIEREDGVPAVEVHDPNQAHKDVVRTLDDKDMHDVTAYLATIK